MRRLRYQVAATLDGFIAGPNGEFDWIPDEPSFDFVAHFAQFDTLLMGRKTWETTNSLGLPVQDQRIIVVSRTLPESPGITVIPDLSTIPALKQQPGKDIWLFGGGELFRACLEQGIVDTVEVAVVPVLLGAGIPLLAPGAPVTKLQLTAHKTYPAGMVLLEYRIDR